MRYLYTLAIFESEARLSPLEFRQEVTLLDPPMRSVYSSLIHIKAIWFLAN
jgi:hypothetical protein